MTETTANPREFILPLRVYYEDTDAGGVVYHSQYLNFMERARTEWLRELGFEQDQLLEERRVAFAVRSMQLDFMQPARFNDALEVTARLLETGRASLVFEQQVRRDGKVLCRAEVKIACIHIDKFKPTAIPPDILREMNNAS